MIIMKLGGGLGNQMFQYAFGRALSIKNGDKLSLDIGEYAKHTDHAYYRPFGLGNFNAQINAITAEEVNRVKYPFKGSWGKLARKIRVAFEYRILRRHHLKFESFLLEKKGDVYLEGYFQSEKYFKDIRDVIVREFTLKKPFSPNAQGIADTIRKTGNSVSLHVRRGDYVADPNNFRIYGNHCNQNYYEKALATLSKNKGPLNVFVFSDDIEWVKENIRIPHPTTHVPEKSAPDYELMMLMSLCQSHVIANSTFGWWPAWLDDKKGKVVIAPSVWIPGMDLPIDDILPPEWIRI
jgi:hypothetical protein